jgi:hypothetical protein
MAGAKSAPRPSRDGVGPSDPIADVVAKRDYETFRKVLADDVIFRSPVSRFRFRGSAITSALFERLVKQSDPERWRVHGAWSLGVGQHLLAFTTTVHGHQLDLLLMTRFNERFQITEVAAYCRPMASIAIFPAFVYPHLVSLFRGKVRGTLLRVLFRPLPRLLELVASGGLGFGRPKEATFEAKLPEAAFEANLPTPEQSSTPKRSPTPKPAPKPTPSASDGPRSPFRRI